jgi:hypothetical protein
MRFKGRSHGSCEKLTCTSRYGPCCLALLRNSSLTIRAMAVAEKTTVAKVTVSGDHLIVLTREIQSGWPLSFIELAC